MKETVKVWIDFAEKDFKAKELLKKTEGMELIFAFHCQQTIEKLMKAILVENDIFPHKTHDLGRLCAIMPSSYKNQLNNFHTQLDELGQIYLDSRYPSDFAMLPNATLNESDIEHINYITDQLYDLMMGFFKTLD
ncbi:MAG: HEPN domain-containing protein [Caldisericia bacterium]|nr:HEPN domain-containing protein [Caldisericia bacterium]